MTTINNNTTAMIAHNYLDKAQLDLQKSVARMSSGKASAFPGDHVAETAIATTLSSNAKIQEIALNTAAQASQLIDITYTAMDEMLNILGRQEALASQASSDNMSDIERKAIQREFCSLTAQLDLITEQANYNNVTLLTGNFTGASHIRTQQTVSQMVYDITRPDQYISHGIVGDNPILERNSTMKVSDKIGKDKANGFIEFSENLKVGDKIVINGHKFKAVDVNATNLHDDEFKLGCNLKETLQNLAKTLNTSKLPGVAEASYRVASTHEVNPCVDAAEDDKPPIPNDKDLRLIIEHNTAGTIGNEFTIGTELAVPEDKGIEYAKGSLKFSGNLVEGNKISAGGVEFTATRDINKAKKADCFLIGKDTKTTMQHLVDKLNQNPISGAAKYTVTDNGLDIRYHKRGEEGNKFTIGAELKDVPVDQNAKKTPTPTTGIIANGTDTAQATAEIPLPDGRNNLQEGDTFTIDGVDFIAKAKNANKSNKEFNIEGNLEGTIAELQRAIDDVSSDSNVKDKYTLMVDNGKIKITAKAKGKDSNGKKISITPQKKGDEVNTTAPTLTMNNTQSAEAKTKLVTRPLEGGKNQSTKVDETPAKNAVLVIEYNPDKNYKAEDSITIGTKTYSFLPKGSSPAAGKIVLGDKLDQTMKSIVDTVNADIDVKKKVELKYDSNKLTITTKGDNGKVMDSANLRISLKGTEVRGKLKKNDTLSDLPSNKTIAELISDGANIDGTQAPQAFNPGNPNGEAPKITNKVNINNTGTAIPQNGIACGTLLHGTDKISGTHASVIIDFSDNTTNKGNFADKEKITLNGEIFTFAKKFTDSNKPSSQTSINIGDSIDDALNNLVQVVNSSAGKASDALLQYDSSTHKLTITSKKTGTVGNEYNFNFGGSAKVKYAIGSGGEATSEKKLMTIHDAVSKDINAGTLGTNDSPVLFSQNMKGELSELKAQFRAGDPGNKADVFTNNSIKFFVRLNGETYETEYIGLSGGNKTDTTPNGCGYQNMGDFLAGGTILTFQRVGGDPTEAGFTLKVRPEGIKIDSTTSPEEIQKELNNLTGITSRAIKTGDLKIGLGLEGKQVKSYGLSNINQFISSGSALKGSHLAGGVEFFDSTGLTKAQGVIEFRNNNFEDGDYLTFNGTKVIAGQDFTIGAGLAETVDNIVSALNRSKDNNIAQASYSRVDNRLVVTYKQAGTIGNNFKISAKFTDRCGDGQDNDQQQNLCDSKDASMLDHLNAVKINGGPDFLSDTPEVALGQKDPTVNDKYVVLGANKKNIDNIMPTSLIGHIENLRAELIDGHILSGGGFVPNSLKFSANVNGRVYSGQIDLSGGGFIDGSGYNGFGNFLAGGSKIMLDSEDGTHSIALTLDEGGIVLPGKNDGKITRNDVLRELTNIIHGMNKGLSNIKINQRRQVSSFDVARTLSGVLNGIRADNVYYQAPDFDKDGKGGLIEKFKVDNKESTISVKIGDRLYTQVLNKSVEEGGLGSNYDAINKVIKGGINTTLILSTSDQNEARALVINLQGVSDINIKTDNGALALENALNSAFGVSDGAGLRFQIGINPTDLITLTFPDLTSKALYRDEDNQYCDIDVFTKQNAINAVKIVHNAIDKLRQERATIGASQSQFEAVSSSLRASIRALKSSMAVLSDIDIASAIEDYTLSALRANAASTALVHTLTSLRDITMGLLQRI